jgi:four helix bundle protein
MVKGYRDLEVWKKAHRLVLDVYQVTSQFPNTERFGIVSQLRRAAYSIPANVAEGFGRRSTKELLQAIAIANGSLEELRYFLLLGKDLSYIAQERYEMLEQEAKSVAQMLAALTRSLRSRLESATARSSLPRNTGHGSRNP